MAAYQFPKFYNPPELFKKSKKSASKDKNGNMKIMKPIYQLALVLGSCCDRNDETIINKFLQPFLFCFGLLFFSAILSNEYIIESSPFLHYQLY